MTRQDPPNSQDVRNNRRTAWWLAAAATTVLLLAIGIWWGLGGQVVVAGPPRLAVDREAIDLGTLPYDQPVSAVFQLRNVGTSTLHILGEPAVELVEGC